MSRVHLGMIRPIRQKVVIMNNTNARVGIIKYKKRLKWYEKIWYFLTGKKNEWIEVGKAQEIELKDYYE